MSLASDLIADCVLVLNDTGNTTWTASELLGWLNQGVAETVNARPDAGAVSDPAFALAAGWDQQIPDGWLRFLDLPGLVRLDHEEIRRMNPYWQSTTATDIPSGFFFDPNLPKRFMVFPPSTGAATVNLRGVALPAAMAATTDAFPLPESYRPAVVSYALFRSFSKDYEGNTAAKAAGYYEAFKAALGIKAQAEAAARAEETGG